jgi:hypothetical protein
MRVDGNKLRHFTHVMFTPSSMLTPPPVVRDYKILRVKTLSA